MLTTALEENSHASFSTHSPLTAESAAALSPLDKAVQLEYGVFSSTKTAQGYKLNMHKKVSDCIVLKVYNVYGGTSKQGTHTGQ